MSDRSLAFSATFPLAHAPLQGECTDAIQNAARV